MIGGNSHLTATSSHYAVYKCRRETLDKYTPSSIVEKLY